MALNKLPNNFTEEELINLLNTQLPETVLSDDVSTPDTVKFLVTFNIKPGTYLITYNALFKLYKSWSQSPVLKKQFIQEVGRYIPKTVNTKKFKINEKDITISQRIFKLLNHNKPTKLTKGLKIHIDKFINDNNLMKGDQYIKVDILHEKYWKWCIKTKKSKRLSLKTFQDVLKLYFPLIKNQHNEYVFGLNYNEKEKTNTTITE